MDEPLGALDKQLREKMQFEITERSRAKPAWSGSTMAS